MDLGALIGMFGGRREAHGTWLGGLEALAGTSVGSLFACMLSVWDPWQIWDYIRTTGFREIARDLFDQDLREATKHQSLNSGKALRCMLRKGLRDMVGDPDMTLAGWYLHTGKRLVITVTNMDTGQAEFWCHRTMPTLEVWKALRASVSLPLLFPVFVVRGHRYSDGGVACNIPCHRFPAAETVTFFVNSPEGDDSDSYLRTLVNHYSLSAQLGSMRAEPRYALNSVVCMAATDNVSPYALNASSGEIDALVEQGARCWRALALRNLAVALCVFTCLIAAREGSDKSPPPRRRPLPV